MNDAREIGQRVTTEQHDEVLRRFDVFKSWFEHEYMDPREGATLVIFPIDTVKPRYRDQYPGNADPTVPGIRNTFISPILRAPELTIPSKSVWLRRATEASEYWSHSRRETWLTKTYVFVVGEIPYHSRITDGKETLPISASIMAAPGSDVALIERMLDFLGDTGRPTKVATGRSIIRQTEPGTAAMISSARKKAESSL